MSAPRGSVESWLNVPCQAGDPLDEEAVAELRRSIEDLHGQTPRSCGHPAYPLWVCGVRPGFGVVCHACTRRHVLRHPHEAEHRCGGCGVQAETMVPLLVQLPRPRWLRPPRAAMVRSTAAVFVCGVGLCEPCAVAACCPVAA